MSARTHLQPFLLPVLLLVLACSSGEEPDSTAVGTATGSDPLAGYLAPDDVEREAVATVQLLFDALETGDAELLRAVMDPTVVMHFSETRDGTTTFGSSSVDALAERITSSTVPLVERMWDPVVVVDGPMATVWTPYDFYVGPDFSHCGVDVATLMQRGERWTIVALSWTRQQPPACALHPDGPPA